jgi:hypothetical protein
VTAEISRHEAVVMAAKMADVSMTISAAGHPGRSQ